MLHNMEVAVVGAGGLLRAGIVSLLAGVTRRAYETPDIETLHALSEEGAHFDVVLLESQILDGRHAAQIAYLRAMEPSCRIAVLGDTLDQAQLTACFAAGADGFLLKDISPDTLIESLRLVALGEKVYPSSLSELFSGNHAGLGETNDLSERERDILRCLMNGDSNKRIANRLNITEATVKVHLKSVLRKTRTANRTQAAIWAHQQGMHKVKDEDRAGEVFESKLPLTRY
jgi:two-component system nitrate/nitrite response regulator NarL